MLRSKLKNKANKFKIIADIAAYKRQRNYVVHLNKQSKHNYFDSLYTKKGPRQFWNVCKPQFSNKHSKKDTSIILVEKDKLTLSEMKIATTFSSGVL